MHEVGELPVLGHHVVVKPCGERRVQMRDRLRISLEALLGEYVELENEGVVQPALPGEIAVPDVSHELLFGLEVGCRVAQDSEHELLELGLVNTLLDRNANLLGEREQMLELQVDGVVPSAQGLTPLEPVHVFPPRRPPAFPSGRLCGLRTDFTIASGDDRFDRSPSTPQSQGASRRSVSSSDEQKIVLVSGHTASRLRIAQISSPKSGGHVAPVRYARLMTASAPTRRQARVFMVQGTASSAGKSVLVAGLARVFARRGYDVAPFKSENLALNSAVTPEGAEIGRAQAFQAAAAGVEPHADMNPVLLKPCSSTGCQVIVLGSPVDVMQVSEYYSYQAQVWPEITGALERLRSQADLVVIEGAGSPAEINIRDRDIANMEVALHAEAPVIIVADIDRGGVFASLVGTMELLAPEERELVAGFVINRFRGDVTQLDSGIEMLEQRYGVPVLGVLPYMADWRGDEEDSLGIDTIAEKPGAPVTIAAVRLPYISNFTDLSALSLEPDVSVRWARTAADLRDVDAVIVPGSKSTASDLGWLRASGLADAIVTRRKPVRRFLVSAAATRCLARASKTRSGVEGELGSVTEGLGLLDTVTVFEAEKRTVRVIGELTGAALGDAGRAVSGYEIHMGRTSLGPGAEPLALVAEKGVGHVPDGAVSRVLPVLGTYLHGVFDEPGLRRGWVDALRSRKGLGQGEPANARDPLDRLADMLEEHLDLMQVARIVGLPLGAAPQRAAIRERHAASRSGDTPAR